MLKIDNIISLIPLVAVVACTDLTFYGETGSQPDAELWEKDMTVSLKTKQYTENTVVLTLTNEYGVTSAELDLVLRSNQPAGQRLSVDLTVDGSLLRGYEAAAGLGVGTMDILPSAYYRFTDGTYISLPQDSRESSPYGLEIYARNSVGQSLDPGRYLLPVAAAGASRELAESVVYIDVTVPEPYEDPDGVRLYSGREMFTVFYLNTSMFDPRLANDMVLMTDWGDESSPRIGIGNIVNLRTASVGYDETTGKVSVAPSSDLRYVLEHYAERVAPVQESGRKVCICIEGGGKGGFCNFNDDQITDFVASVKRLVETYRLDGINLWDRNTGYGTEGVPAMNTTSYPRLIQKLREALGPQKLLTVVDYQEPTAYFDDVEKTGGIAVGEYIDYAWHGYNDASEPLQVIDPWSDADYLSKEYTGTKIAGLDHINYGCIHWSPRVDGYGFSDSAKPWVDDNKPYAIFVFYDIQSNLQSGGSDGSYQYPGTLLRGTYNFNYSQDLDRLANTEGITQYGKWLKDW